jgi:hypothetical protein
MNQLPQTSQAVGFGQAVSAVRAPAWARGRRFFTADELRARPVPPVAWPTVSIGLLCVLAAQVSAAVLTAMNLYLVALAALVLLAGRHAPPRQLMGLLLPFLAMIVIGIFRGLVEGETYAFLRDGWYFSNPVMVIVVGYVLGRHIDAPARGLRAFVIGSTVVALLHLSLFVRFPDLLSLRAIDLRSYTGTGYFAPVLGVVILLGHFGRWRSELLLPRWLASACLFFNSSSIVLSYSRTLALVFLVAALAVGGFFARQVLLRMTVLLMVLLLAVLAVRSVIDPESEQARTTQIGKFGRVFEEVWVTERMSRSQIDDNWRGYEAARALGQWTDGGPPRWLFGEGMGAMVDVGLFQTMTRDRRDARRFFPIFHNGYMTVLVKTGLVGIGLYLAFLARLYGIGRRAGNTDVAFPAYRLGRLVQACAATLAVSTAVWFGTFHKFDLLPVLLMIGFLLSQLTADQLGAVERRA